MPVKGKDNQAMLRLGKIESTPDEDSSGRMSLRPEHLRALQICADLEWLPPLFSTMAAGRGRQNLQQ